MTVGPFDFVIFSYLNGFAGQSGVLDALIVLTASFLPFLIVLGFLAAFTLRYYAHRRHLPRRVAQFDVEGVAAISALVAASAANLVAFGLQTIFVRPRPYLTLNTPHLFSVAAWSFPSGHAMIFFAISAAAHYFDRRIGALLYLGTTLVVIARVAAGVHYPTDIIVGAVLGIGIGTISAVVLSRLAKYEAKKILHLARARAHNMAG